MKQTLPMHLAPSAGLKKLSRYLSILAFVCFTMGGLTAQASMVVWTLENVTFSDGGTAIGSFTWDSNTNAIPSWNVQVSGGSTDFPATTYSPFQPSGVGGTLFGNNAAVTFSFIDSNPPLTSSSSLRYIVLDMVAPLNTNGGSLAMATLAGGFSSQGFECFNCNPGRSVIAGSINGVPLPLPPTIWLLGGTMAAWAGLTKRGKKSPRSLGN
jgi:hypothetical protein